MPSTSGSRAGCSIRRKDLLIRYGCDPRRLYEIWEEKRFAGSRDKALKLFQERYPGLTDRIDYGRHRTHPPRRAAGAAAGLVRSGLTPAAGRMSDYALTRYLNPLKRRQREQTQNFLSTWPSNRGMFSLRSRR